MSNTLFSNTAGFDQSQSDSTGSQAFAVRCAFGSDEKLSRKEERMGTRRTIFEYGFDSAGHLEEVRCNGEVVERYVYNPKGQRTADMHSGLGRMREFQYDGQGRLFRAGEVTYTWTPSGSLAVREAAGSRTTYTYGNDTRLDSLRLPDGREIRYIYGDGLMPERVLCDGRIALEYIWEGPLRLVACRDHLSEAVWRLEYADGRLPVSVWLDGPAGARCGVAGQALGVHTDQVGSVRLLTRPDGTELKRLEYDAFGTVLYDSLPWVFFPLGFAGGLRDPFSALTRFGFRDYDSEVGRFTAKDPLGDTGGDHDLYDYCVDDPVSMNDPSGLKGEQRGKDEQRGKEEFGWLDRTLWWARLPRESREYQDKREAFLEAMRGERKLPKYSLWEAAVPLWRPLDDPTRQEAVDALKGIMGREAAKWGTGYLSVDELPWLTPGTLLEKVVPNYQRPKVGDSWTKDGVRK